MRSGEMRSGEIRSEKNNLSKKKHRKTLVFLKIIHYIWRKCKNDT